jgi:NAD(P)-dependent dehydrogenase (short-subunit alcohol dehydrogenase family)
MDEKLIGLVTGANRGIGFEITRQLAKNGITVIMTARDPSRGVEARQILVDEGLDVSFQKLDVTNGDEIDELFAYIEKEFGGLDILINNAAIAIDDDFNITEVDLDLVRQTLETNLYGPWRLCQVFLPLLKVHESGWIINLTSRMGSLDELDGWAPSYRLSKAALNTMTKMMAVELEGSGIRIHAVCPGWIKTELGGEDAPGTVEKPAEFITKLILGLDTDSVSSIALPELIV